MSPHDSVISRTGQGPKALVAVLGMILGGTASIIGSALFKSHPDLNFVDLAQLGGAVLGLGAMFFACRSIRCPGCGTRWVWDSLSRDPANRWMQSLLNSRVCPKCGYPDVPSK